MAKIDVIRDKFKDKIKPIDFIELANNIDNSKTKKYAEHLIRFTKGLSEDFEHTASTEMGYIMEFLLKFDELSKNGLIENPDLNQHKNFASIKKSIKEASLTKSIGKAKKEIKILYEDDKYMLFIPLSFDAASVYGRGTKWCVTQAEYFYRYTDKGILAYFIDKDKNRKIGLYFDMYVSYYHTVMKPYESSELTGKSFLRSKVDYGKEIYDERRDEEMRDIYNFSSQFSCWTDWDCKMEMMFLPMPHNIKEIFINYCKEKNIQNTSLLDETELNTLISYHNGNQVYDDFAENEIMVNENQEMNGGMELELPPPIDYGEETEVEF